MRDRDQLVAQRDQELHLLRERLQALQNYITTLIVEREQQIRMRSVPEPEDLLAVPVSQSSIHFGQKTT